MGTPVLVRIGAIVSSCATQRRVFDVGSDVLRIASRSHLKWGLASSSHHFGLPALLGPGALAEADFGFGTTGAGITSPHHSRMLLSVSTSWSRACSKSASLAFGSPSLIWRALTSSEGVRKKSHTCAGRAVGRREWSDAASARVGAAAGTALLAHLQHVAYFAWRNALDVWRQWQRSRPQRWVGRRLIYELLVG
eukprot:scaffold283800_cov30-Tisochrysis_lutea.AAC.2